MPLVTVEGEGTFEVPDGKKLVMGIEDSGVDILHRCGGQALCTTCRVQVLEGDVTPMTEAELEVMEEHPELVESFRLSCQIRVQNDLTVRVVNRAHKIGIPPGPRPED